ncbi:hypothetical protein CFC21_035329 [Triticum aestivum]|uniref:Uncharacterized protein n=3 Tax=Triticum TaxID=4564 RepID=A0A9R0RII3_TRITD|nr:hypothetical protein CFC21_035329 [Triticum aestivum]VAH12432.1 unnamed protein product [Triticum turgidum subsp. durum]VAH61187.1 unnamed protein product [Triticum turgidum subsp. durum]VAI26336.1 unnamed protein product [Triticum turgidum subsp. durum]
MFQHAKRFIFQYNPTVISFYSHWTKIPELCTFWTLLLLIPCTDGTHSQNMCAKLYGLQNTYKRQCQKHALGLYGMRIFSYGIKKS